MMADKEISNLIANRIRGLCLEKCINLSCLAKRSGVSLTTLYRLANGKSGNVKIETIMRLCSGLGITLKKFWTDE